MTVSRSYLASYLSSYDQAQRFSVQEIVKGKAPLMELPTVHEPVQVQVEPWPRPPQGWTALSTAGTFINETGEASTGMILRTSDGSVIFSPYRCLFYCKDVLEAEISATILEGLSLSLQRSDLPIMIRSENPSVVAALTDDSLDRSAFGHLMA